MTNVSGQDAAFPYLPPDSSCCIPEVGSRDCPWQKVYVALSLVAPGCMAGAGVSPDDSGCAVWQHGPRGTLSPA